MRQALVEAERGEALRVAVLLDALDQEVVGVLVGGTQAVRLGRELVAGDGDAAARLGGDLALVAPVAAVGLFDHRGEQDAGGGEQAMTVDEIVPLLKCVECGAPVKLADSRIACTRCDAAWTTVNGVFDLRPRASLPLPRMYEDQHYREWNRRLAQAHGSAMLRIIPGAGHRLRHDPRAVAILLGWLDRQRNALAPAET